MPEVKTCEECGTNCETEVDSYYVFPVLVTAGIVPDYYEDKYVCEDCLYDFVNTHYRRKNY